MPARDPRVTRYIADSAPFARPILRHLRKVIHGAGSGIEETIKWGMPSFLCRGRIVCGIAGFKAHCALWFWRGKTVIGLKPREGMGSFGRIASLKDLPSDAKIKGYVEKAIKLIEQRNKSSAVSRSSRR